MCSLRLSCQYVILSYTETGMSSFWWNFHHWLHWKLSFWQLPVQPVTKISSNYNIPASVYSSGKLLKCAYLNKSPNVDFSAETITNEVGAYRSHSDPCCLSACDVLLFYSVFILEKSMFLHKVVLLILGMYPALNDYLKIHFILEKCINAYTERAKLESGSVLIIGIFSLNDKHHNLLQQQVYNLLLR